MGRKVAWGNAENYVPPGTYRIAVSLVSNCATGSRQSSSFRANLESEECNPARLDETASHFPGIGVLSAQSTVAT